jgi:hypothetical protein
VGDAVDDTATFAASASQGPEARLGVSALFSRAIVEGEAFVRAEVVLYRAKALRRAFSAGVVAALIVGALMLTLALIIAILIGIILTIAPAVGMGWSVVIVSCGTLLVILTMLLVARVRLTALLKSGAP